MSALLELPRAELVRRAWFAGDLSWKLWHYQDALYAAIRRMIRDPACRQGTVNVSRQFGKTHVELIVANELCVEYPGAQIRFGAPTGLELRKRTLPIMRSILKDCPRELRPRWNSEDKVWDFRNGSQIHMAGVNNGHADDLRGAACHVGFPDECGFIDEFGYLVDSVLTPMTTRTGGTIIGSSTPPRTTAHDFRPFAKQCELDGHYYHATIWDTDLPRAEIEALMHAAGGADAITWRREYLAQFVVDTELQVIPEWRSDYIADAPADPRRRWYHNYSTLDFGLTRRDFHAGVFSHYDFANGILWVEDELVDSKLPRMNPDALVHAIRAKEAALWGPDPHVHSRRADNNAVELLVQMAELGLVFMPVSKDQLAAMVAKVRMWMKDGRIRISPRCKLLIATIEQGIWKDERHINVEFDRNATLGHLDLLAALIYQVRYIDEQHNPVPRGWNLGPDQILIERTEEAATLRDWFGGPKADEWKSAA